MATAVTVPLVVILALVFDAVGVFGGGGSDSAAHDPTATITTTAPPHGDQFAQACTTLLTALPVRLNQLTPRVVEPSPPSPFVVAWGDPAIVVKCGVDRPKDFTPRSALRQLFPGGNLSGAWYWTDNGTDPEGGKAEVFTAIDRAAYVSLSLPQKYQGSDYLPVLNAAVLKAFPKAVCSTDSDHAATASLCVERKD